MKTTANFIEELLQRPIAESEITDLTFTMVGMLMKQYAEHVRDEDRKVIAENVKFDGMVFTFRDGSSIGTPKDKWCWEHGIQANKESIINAPKQELK